MNMKRLRWSNNMKIKIKLLKDVDIYVFYNEIYNILNKKGYKLEVNIPTQISFSRNYPNKGFIRRQAYYLKKYSCINTGVINIKKENAQFEITANIENEKNIFFYYSILIITSLAFYFRANLYFAYVIIFLILIYGVLFIGYYLASKSFIYSLINGIDS
jgi:hypothetical protein